MQKERAKEPRRMSLALKLNLVTIGVILVLAAGLIAILFNSYMTKINQLYQDTVNRSVIQTLEECAKSPITFSDEGTTFSVFPNLATLIDSEEFDAIRKRALDEDDETLVWEWLRSKPSAAFASDPEFFRQLAEDIRTGNHAFGNPEETLTGLSMAGDYNEVEALLIEIQALNGLDRLAILVPRHGRLCLLAESVSAEESLASWHSIGRVEDIPLAANGSLPLLYPAEFVHNGSDVVLRAYQPIQIYNEEGSTVLGLVLAEINMNTVLHEYNWFALRSIVLVAVLVALAILTSIFLTRRFATKPLRLLAQGMRQFGKGEKGYTREDILSLPIRSRDEIGDLYRDIGDMQTRIVDYVDDLARITSERERMEAELHLAARIQNAMLPSAFPAFPDRTDFDLYASMVPAKDVGGDFYGFFLVDPDHLALLIADVSGKGIPAALFMMASVITISDRAMAGGTPAEILTAANTAIHKQNSTHMFVTAWLGILDLRTGVMTCANAGHEYPMVRRGGVFSLLKDPHGLVIGGFAQANYRNYEIRLAPGDAVYVYTDGVAEASDPSEAFYGTERLMNTLNAHAAGTPKEILAAVSEDVKAFAAGAEQFDDITMLCVEYRGPGANAPS